MSQPNVLPDSRLKDPKETVKADWSWRNPATGLVETIRLELEPIYCFNCGKPNGHTPRGLMSYVSWMCEACAETWGGEAKLHNCADADFWAKVKEACLEIYGRELTQADLERLAAEGRLGQLELLERESPYRRMQPSCT
jgi:hypothetical protein